MESRSQYILTSILPQIEIVINKIFDLEVDLLSLERKLMELGIDYSRDAKGSFKKNDNLDMK